MDLSTLPGDQVGFLVVLDGDDEPTRIEGPFGLQDGRHTFGPLPRIPLEGGTIAVAVTVPTDRLEELAPGFSVELTPAVALLLDPAEDLTRDATGNLLSVHPLPVDAGYLAVGDDPPLAGAADPRLAPLQRRGRLRIPFEPEYCRPSPLDQMPTFGDPLGALSDADIDKRFDSVAIVDRDRVIAETGGWVMVLERDTQLTSADLQGALPRRAISIDELFPGGEAFVTAVAVDPTAGGTRVVLGVNRRRRDGAPTAEATVLEMNLSPEGLDLVATTTRAVGRNLQDVVFAPDGELAISGNAGFALFAAPGDTRLRAALNPLAAEDRNRRIAFTHDPAERWIMTGRNQVWRFDEASQRWGGELIPLALGSDNTNFDGLAAAPGLQWVGASDGRLFEYGDSWATVELAMPPRYGRCTPTPDAARPPFLISVDELRIVQGHVLSISDECPAVMIIRAADKCVSLWSLEGLPLESGENLVRGIDGRDGWVVAVGDEGRVWAAPGF